MTLYFLILFILGTAFWSFSTVLIERWKHGKWGIVLGRSECPKCNHTLSGRELIPIVSYMIQRGKCRNCKSKISPFYPIVETVFWCIFLVMGWASIRMGHDPISLQTWLLLFLGFITWVYIIYDTRYMEIPDQIMIPGIGIYLILLFGWYFSEDFRSVLFDIGTYENYTHFLRDHIWASILIYSFFYLQILLPGGFYLLRKKRIPDFIELLFSYFTFPFMLFFGKIFSRQHKDEEEEIPTWIGGGDLRIALFIGITLWGIHTISSLLFSYILWSIIGILVLWKRWKKNSMIAFGPFLWIGWILSIVFYEEILSYIIL